MVREPIAALIREALDQAARQHGWTLPAMPGYLIEAPKDPRLGDVASNVAMSLARPLGVPPMRIAEAIAAAVPVGAIADISAAPPGFLNFRLRHDFLLEALARRRAGTVDDCMLKLATMVADHVNEAIATGRVPPEPIEDPTGLTFHLLVQPTGRVEADAVRGETLDNPWFYVRQARDRMAGVLTTAAADGLHPAPRAEGLDAPEERQLLILVAGLEGEQALALERNHPQRLARAATELASGFHQFYTACRVFGTDRVTAENRLALVEGALLSLTTLLAALENR